MFALPQVVGNMFGEENVTSISAVHNASRDVNSGSGYIALFAEVRHFRDRSTMNAHANPEFGSLFQCTSDLYRTPDRRFEARPK